jgi:choline-sulfatase
MRKFLSKSLANLLGRGRDRRPLNVLWICADDFAPYVSSTYGNPLAKTPHLDRLACQGIRFDRAYCACPLSTPSRMAFLTGRYPRSVGVTLSHTALPEDEVTIGGLLRRKGYEATAFGKTHYYDPLLREFDRCIDLYEHEACLATLRSRPVPTDVEVLGPWLPFCDPASVWLNSTCLPYAPDAEMPDTFFSQMAGRFLGQERSKPFFVWVGFYVTHSPFRFPIEFRGRFKPSSFVPPDVGLDDVDRIPPVFRDLTCDEKRGIAASYYTSVEYMDRNVGLILDALERSGHSGDTIVVFNSDHGYLLGQHGRFEKHCCYEESVRSALIMRLPGVIEPGRATGALVELIDIVPTILELCGVEVPANVQGKSLAPLLRGGTDRHRDRVIVEYADNAEAMLRTDCWKLIYSAGNRRRRDGYALEDGLPGPSVRLYDMVVDPGEMTDMAKHPTNAPVVERLLGELAIHMSRTARYPEKVSALRDVRAILDVCLTPGEMRR